MDSNQHIIFKAWVLRADSDMRVVELILRQDPGNYEQAAVHIQQAAEKLMKGMLIVFSVGFSKTHDLQTLADQLKPHLAAHHELLDECANYSSWWIAGRYPDDGNGLLFDATLEEVRSAFENVKLLKQLSNSLN